MADGWALRHFNLLFGTAESPTHFPAEDFETILKELHLACRIGGGSSDTVRRRPGPLAETSREWG
jgi:hypothetical protein